MYEPEKVTGRFASGPLRSVPRPPVLLHGAGGFTVARIPKEQFRYDITGHADGYYNIAKIVAALQWAWYREMPDIGEPSHIALPQWYINILDAVDYGDTLFEYVIMPSEMGGDIYLVQQVVP
jgi:hypothetical protein